MRKLLIKQFTNAPKQLMVERTVNAPIADVWNIVADHQGMTSWMPMIKQVDLIESNQAGNWEAGSERHCQFGADLLKEKIVHWDPPYGYAYMISDMHIVKDHLGYFQLEEVPEGTKITWTQYFVPNGNAVKNWMSKNVMLPSVMKKALRNLRNKVA